MAILVWDNGGCYSDHHVHFLNVEDRDPDVVAAVLLAYQQHNSSYKGRAIAVIQDADWRDPKAVAALTEELEPWPLTEHYILDDEERVALMRAIPRDMLEWLVDRWRADPCYQSPDPSAMLDKILVDHARAQET